MSERAATEAEIAAVLDCLRSGWLTMGPRTQAFELAFAGWAGTAHAVAVGSGAAALHLALLALDVQGEQVTVPAPAPPLVAEAVRWAGGEPRPVDDGEPADVAVSAGGFQLHGLTCFSFDARGLFSLGEGGMVTTDSQAHAERIRSLRGHALTSGTWDRHRGHAAGYDVVDIGFNYRLDEIRAALGMVRLAAVSRARRA